MAQGKHQLISWFRALVWHNVLMRADREKDDSKLPPKLRKILIKPIKILKTSSPLPFCFEHFFRANWQRNVSRSQLKNIRPQNILVQWPINTLKNSFPEGNVSGSQSKKHWTRRPTKYSGPLAQKRFGQFFSGQDCLKESFQKTLDQKDQKYSGPVAHNHF